MFGHFQIRVFLEQGLRLVARFFDEGDVGDGCHFQHAEARLSCAEEFAWAALLQVAVGQDEAVVGFGHGLQTFVLDRVFVVGDEEAVGLRRAASDAAAQLVELGEAEMVRALHQHDRRVRNVHADFDHGGRDEHVVLLVAEVGHDAVFFVGLHASVQETEFEFGENFLLEFFVFLGGGFEIIHLLALFHERIDDEGLASVFDLRADEGEGALQFLRTEDVRFDGLTSRGHFVHDGEIEVAVEGEGERTRNRGGGHHQKVGRCAFVAERGALFDAEAMLFVNHDELQILELDGVFDQRVRADDNLNRPVRKTCADFGFLRFGRVADEQTNVRARKQIGKTAEMLVSQNRSGSHNGGLRARLIHHRGGERGDDSFARANVALQQTIHRAARVEVAADLVEGAGLGACQGEGKASHARAQPLVGGFEAACGRGLPVALLSEHSHLQKENFVEGKSGAGAFEFVLRVGEMRLPDGAAEREQPRRCPNRIGQVIHERGRPVRHHLVHQSAQPLLRDLGGERVNRDDAIGVQVFGFDGFKVGVGHHEAAKALREFSRSGNVVAHFHAVGDPRLVEPREPQRARAVGDDGFGELQFAAPHWPRANRLHRADDGDDFVDPQIFDGLQLAVIFVATREIIEHVAERGHAERAEGLRVTRSDALEDGEQRAERGGCGGCLATWRALASSLTLRRAQGDAWGGLPLLLRTRRLSPPCRRRPPRWGGDLFRLQPLGHFILNPLSRLPRGGRGWLRARLLLLLRTGLLRSLLRTRLALRFLLGFGIGFAETFPQSLERVGATLGSQRFVAFKSLGHGLDDGFVHALGAGFAFPKIEDLDQSADDGGVVVSVLVFETEEFA